VCSASRLKHVTLGHELYKVIHSQWHVELVIFAAASAPSAAASPVCVCSLLRPSAGQDPVFRFATTNLVVLVCSSQSQCVLEAKEVVCI
jgi:hypothetical protein